MVRKDPLSLPTDEVPPLLSPSQVARLLSVHAKTVRKWVREGRIRGRKLGPAAQNRVLIERAEIERLLGLDQEDP